MKLPDDDYDDLGSISEDSDELENDEEERTFAFSDAEHWLQEFALPHYLRSLSSEGRKWAPNWYDYPEADTLIQLLWRAWEQARWDGVTATLDYFRDYFYPIMNLLTNKDGPFHAYDKITHPELPEPFPVHDAPAGHFSED